jgi:hypothetical protein
LEGAASEAETGVTGNALGLEEAAPVSRHRVSKYRHYKPKNLGMVVINGHAHYLGKYDSPESWERYHLPIADLYAGRQVGPETVTGPVDDRALTINELILAYMRFADGYYVKDGRPTVEPNNIRLVLRLVRRLYGTFQQTEPRTIRSSATLPRNYRAHQESPPSR